MILTKWIISDAGEEKKPLYCRGAGASINSGRVILKAKQSVSFDTYYNALFYGPYQQNAEINNIFARVISSGRLRLRLCAYTQEGKRIVLATSETGNSVEETILSSGETRNLPLNGMLFVEAEALTDSVIHGGAFETGAEEQTPVYLAAIICTYHREDYVQRNLARIRHGLMDTAESGVSDAIDCLVIDNGGTLALEQSNRVLLFQNRNYGGSGGFTRGLIEAYRRRQKYTHVLLMDDDISFEPEVLARTIRLLRILKRQGRPVCIGGQMLQEGKPTVQYEAGGNFVKSRIQSVGRGMDLSSPGNLLKNTAQSHVSFNAWWYCCFPLSEVERIGLPYPFFIKCDDIEYGMRMCPKLLLCNGIGVWHRDFSQKVSPHLEYYIKRNELIVSILHDGKHALGYALDKIVRACAKASLIGDSRNIDFILMAYRDFMKGPSFFENTDEEQLNRQLTEMGKKPATGRLKACLTVGPRVMATMIKLILVYRNLRNSYPCEMKRYSTMDFWSRHLNIEAV